MNPTSSLGGGSWSHVRSFFLTLGLSMIGLISYELFILRGEAGEWDRFTWEFVAGVFGAGVFLCAMTLLSCRTTLQQWFDVPGRRAYETVDRLDRRVITPQAMLRKLAAKFRKH